MVLLLAFITGIAVYIGRDHFPATNIRALRTMNPESLLILSLVVGGISINVAGRTPVLLLFDVCLLLLFCKRIVWLDWPAFSDRLMNRLVLACLLLQTFGAFINPSDILKSVITIKALLFGFLFYALLEKKRIYAWCVPVCLGVAGLATLWSYYASAREGIYTIGEIKDDVVTPLGASNYVACYLMMLLPLGGVYFYRSRGHERLWYGIFVLLGFAGFLVTFSRGAITALLISVLLSLRLIYRSGFRLKHAIAVLVFMAFIVAVFPQEIVLGAYDFVENKISIGDESRTELWHKAISVFQQHPILGVGPGQFVNYSREIGYGNSKLGAHNTYLQTLAESGILGSVPIFALMIASLWRFYKLARFSLDAVHVATWVGILASMIHNAVDTIFWIPQFQVLFWLMTAIAVGAARELNRESIRECGWGRLQRELIPDASE